MAKAQKNFLNGAMILTVSNILVKIIGAIYKIPLANQIHTVGMNYYNDAYQIYALLYVLSTAGVPVAIAKMVSEANVDRRYREPKKILKLSTGIFASVGLVLAALMILFTPTISRWLSNDTANYCISLIAPAIFLVTISATIKGYFQGYKCMTPSAVFQVIEALFKLGGLGLIAVMVARGITDPLILACGGVLGVTFGSFAATVFMVIRYLCEKDLGRDLQDAEPSRSNRSVARTIVTLAIPISLSSSVMSITSTLDMIFVKRSLTHFVQRTVTDAEKVVDTVKEIYGAYVGATGSLFNLPQALTIGISVSVLPFLTTAFAEKRKEDAFRNMRSSSKLVALIGMPCALGMSVMSEPIVKLLYEEGYWSVGIPTLQVLSLSVFFVSFVSLSGIFLQAVGKVKTSLLTMGVGAVMKLAVNIFAVKYIGIMGAPLGTFACYGSITLLNILFIRKYIQFRFPLVEVFLKPLLCSALCCGAAYGVWALLCAVGLSVKLALFPALAVAVIAYALCLWLFKVLSKDDLVFLPGKLHGVLQKAGWIHE